MRALFDIGPMVRKYSALPIERVQVIRDIADFQLSKVRRGIVIIFAPGSGRAVLALQKLTRFLATRDEPIDLVVMNIDSMTSQEMKHTFGREFDGHGETQWIRDGKVVAFLEAYTPETEGLILSYFKRLLDERADCSKPCARASTPPSLPRRPLI